MPNLKDATQFDYLYDALANAYPGLSDADSGSYFQFAAAPIQAEWITGTDINAYDHANAVPANLDGFYVPGDSHLDAAYASLLRSLQPKEGDRNPDYLALQVKLGDAEGVQQSILAQARAGYQVWKADNPGVNGTAAQTFQAWIADPLGGITWKNELDDVQRRIAEYQSELAGILRNMDAAYAEALEKIGSDTMNVSSGSGAVKVPRVVIGGDLAKDKARWDSYPSGKFDFAPPPITFDAQIKSPWKTVYDSKVEQRCFKTSSEVMVNVSRIITDAHYKLEVKAVGLQGYPITRGSWYDASFVKSDAKLTPGAVGVSSDGFFGLEGSLHMVPELLLVMYRPTFSLTVSTQTFKQQFQTNANASIDWIDMFGFRFSFDGLASLLPVDNGNETHTISFVAPANSVPQIIGVVSRAVYNGSANATRKAA